MAALAADAVALAAEAADAVDAVDQEVVVEVLLGEVVVVAEVRSKESSIYLGMY